MSVFMWAVLIVAHQPETIAIADHVVGLGPVTARSTLTYEHLAAYVGA